MVSLLFRANSILGALLVISLLAWLGGVGIGGDIGAGLVSIGMPIFIITFCIWIIFIFLSVFRNFKSLLR